PAGRTRYRHITPNKMPPVPNRISVGGSGVVSDTKKLAVSVPPFGPGNKNVRVAGVFAEGKDPANPKPTQRISGGHGPTPGLSLMFRPSKERENVIPPNVHPVGMVAAKTRQPRQKSDEPWTIEFGIRGNQP